MPIFMYIAASAPLERAAVKHRYSFKGHRQSKDTGGKTLVLFLGCCSKTWEVYFPIALDCIIP